MVWRVTRIELVCPGFAQPEESSLAACGWSAFDQPSSLVAALGRVFKDWHQALPGALVGN
jgi:hypothetical protein